MTKRPMDAEAPTGTAELERIDRLFLKKKTKSPLLSSLSLTECLACWDDLTGEYSPPSR